MNQIAAALGMIALFFGALYVVLFRGGASK
jgi:hypothetical protein